MNRGNAIIEIKGLSRSFHGEPAVSSIDLSVYPGSIIGLLGPNGCGKSTLLRHMIGLYLPDSGVCKTFGCDASALGPAELARIGYVHQEGDLLDWMRVGQLIRYAAACHTTWNPDLEKRYVDEFEIRLRDRVGALSPGQRQKVAILLAIGHEPDLLILDEPATALDPIARAGFLDLLLNLIQKEGKTVLISSHILSDIEKVIDHTLIMKKGRIIVDRNFDDLRERYWKIRLTASGDPLPETLPFENIHGCSRNNGQALLTLEATGIESIRRQAEALDCDIDIHPLPFEDVYRLIMKTQK